MSKVYELLGNFQSKFRDYLVGRLIEAGIHPQVTDKANRQIGAEQLELSDFKWLVLKNPHVFRGDFGAKVTSLPTWLDDLKEVRNKVAHYTELTPEDEELTRILIKKITSFAKLELAPPSPTKIIKVGNQRRRDQIHDQLLDSILLDYPTLQIKRSKTEYRVYLDDGSGRGSIWIMPLKSRYAVVTTGRAQRLDAELERLTGASGQERDDRPYKRWKSVSPDIFPTIFKLFLQI